MSFALGKMPHISMVGNDNFNGGVVEDSELIFANRELYDFWVCPGGEDQSNSNLARRLRGAQREAA